MSRLRSEHVLSGISARYISTQLRANVPNECSPFCSVSSGCWNAIARRDTAHARRSASRRNAAEHWASVADVSALPFRLSMARRRRPHHSSPVRAARARCVALCDRRNSSHTVDVRTGTVRFRTDTDLIGHIMSTLRIGRFTTAYAPVVAESLQGCCAARTGNIFDSTQTAPFPTRGHSRLRCGKHSWRSCSWDL
jgi:hypothetical protein